MKKVIVFLCTLLLLSCDDSSTWFHGQWRIDSELTKQQAHDYNALEREWLNERITRYSGVLLIINAESSSLIDGKGRVKDLYQVIQLEDNVITLMQKGESKTTIIRDDHGVYYPLPINSRAISDKMAKIYLSKTNKQ